jgi:hypothetical protein
MRSRKVLYASFFAYFWRAVFALYASRSFFASAFHFSFISFCAREASAAR